MSEELLYRLENRVAVLTLNRPERLNALTKEMMQGLRERLSACAVDDAVGCVVITGAGAGARGGRGDRGDTGAADRSAAGLDGGVAAIARDAQADHRDGERRGRG